MKLRIYALLLILGILSIQFPYTVVAYVFNELNDDPENCVSCPKSPSELLDQLDNCCNGKVGVCFFNAKEEIPVEQTCCPDGCTHCALPCCGGILIVQVPPIMTEVFPFFRNLPVIHSIHPPLVDPSDIFHPPRG